MWNSRHIDYCMHRVNLLRHHGVKPILVFDGGILPMKIEQEIKRSRYQLTRKENLARAMEHETLGNSSAAYECYQKAVLKQEHVDYIVAPYEADAQLTFLSLNSLVEAVITEDSDLIPFGCSRPSLTEFTWLPQGIAKEIAQGDIDPLTKMPFQVLLVEPKLLILEKGLASLEARRKFIAPKVMPKGLVIMDSGSEKYDSESLGSAEEATCINNHTERAPVNSGTTDDSLPAEDCEGDTTKVLVIILKFIYCLSIKLIKTLSLLLFFSISSSFSELGLRRKLIVNNCSRNMYIDVFLCPADSEASDSDTKSKEMQEKGKFGCDISHLNNYTGIAEKSMEKFVALISSYRYASSGSRASGLRAPLKDVQNTCSSRYAF
ncbi:hypothetical protein BHE74_00042889 [Ensete ventricosum]|nr:hypothetical protein BHE74_00042889 [Ensete ventricosum]